MKADEIYEKRLPLSKHAYPNSRGRKASFVVVMSPQDFIRLTTRNEDAYNNIINSTKVDLDQYKSGDNEYHNIDSYYMPFLNVSSNGRVLGHEGRHRAAMILKAGGDKFPCTIHLFTPDEFQLRYAWHDWDKDEEHVEFETFASYEEAEDRVEELKKDEDRYYVTNIEDRGRILKKMPNMPEALIGQFDPSIVVTDFKYGRAK